MIWCGHANLHFKVEFFNINIICNIVVKNVVNAQIRNFDMLFPFRAGINVAF